MDIIELKRVHKDGFKRHPWELARLRILLFFLKKFAPATSRILDVGSGDAFMARELSRALPSTEVTAVDIHYSEEIKSLILESGLQNLQLLSNLDEYREEAGAVVLMDVVEHIEDPDRFLQEVKTKCKKEKGTVCFITVPAFPFLFSKHDEILGHYKRYTCSSLKELVLKNGFELQECGYFFTSLFFVRTIQKMAGSDFSEGLHDWKGGQLATRLIGAILWTEFKIARLLLSVGIRIPGLTCYCLCRPLPS